MCRLPNRRLPRDGGFTLIESVVALLVAGVVFSALASVLVAGVQASLFGRQNQQATDFMTRRVEELRRMEFASLSHVTGSVPSGGHVQSCGGGQCITVDGVQESIVTDAGGGIAAPVQVVNGDDSNQTEFTINTYVTAIAGQPVDQVRRATVYISWDLRGETHTRSISTVIALTQRGLPLPAFKFELPVNSIEKNPGSDVTFMLTLSNQGAPDRWNIGLSGAGATAGWTVAFDSNGDGVYDSTGDQALTDTTSDAIIDTGRVEPSSSIRIFLTRGTAATEPTGTVDTVVTATSVAQPSAATASASVTATTTLTTGVVSPTPGPSPSPTSTSTEPADCAAPSPLAATKPSNGSYTLRAYPLHNPGLGDTVLQGQLDMNGSAADETLLPHYSTDLDASAVGRVLDPAAASVPTDADVLNLTSSRKFADWAMQMGSKTWFEGTAVLRVWVARHGTGSGPVSVKAVAYSATANSGGLSRTAVGNGTASLSTLGCPGFQEVYVAIPVPQTVVDKNQWLGVRLVAVGTTGESFRVGYDVVGSADRPYPASLTVGTK